MISLFDGNLNYNIGIDEGIIDSVVWVPTLLTSICTKEKTLRFVKTDPKDSVQLFTCFMNTDTFYSIMDTHLGLLE